METASGLRRTTPARALRYHHRETMDYRALAELIWFSLLGLAALALATGLSVRVFLAPVVREVLETLGRGRSEEEARLAARLERVEESLDETREELRRLGAAHDFHRSLEEGGAGHSDDEGAEPLPPVPDVPG